MHVLYGFQASFIIPPEMVPGRMTLLVTLFLVLLGLFLQVLDRQPITETISAISWWMLSCIMFLFWAMLGYIFILFNMYFKQTRVKPENSHMYNGSKANYELAVKTDYFLLIFIPSLFGVFNAIYWVNALL